MDVLFTFQYNNHLFAFVDPPSLPPLFFNVERSKNECSFHCCLLMCNTDTAAGLGENIMKGEYLPFQHIWQWLTIWQLIFAKIGLKTNWSVLRYRKHAQSTAVLRLIMQRSSLFWPVTGQKRQLPPKMVWSHNLHIIASGHFLIQVTRHSPPKRTVYSQFRLEGTKWIETVFQRILLYSATEFTHFGICNGKLKLVGIKDEKSQTKRF